MTSRPVGQEGHCFLVVWITLRSKIFIASSKICYGRHATCVNEVITVAGVAGASRVCGKRNPKRLLEYVI